VKYKMSYKLALKMTRQQILTERRKAPCGCVNDIGGGIDFCNLHRNAGALLKILKNIMKDGPDPYFDYDALVRRAEGKP